MGKLPKINPHHGRINPKKHAPLGDVSCPWCEEKLTSHGEGCFWEYFKKRRLKKFNTHQKCKVHRQTRVEKPPFWRKWGAIP